jgi:hypothetical protein
MTYTEHLKVIQNEVDQLFIKMEKGIYTQEEADRIFQIKKQEVIDILKSVKEDLQNNGK